MILTITIHPLLERRLTYKKINPGSSNRSPLEELKPGGKGINVSRQLNKLGVKNLAYTFLGGHNGKLLKNLFTEEKINYTFVQTKNETRYSIITIDESQNSAATFFSPDYLITSEEADEFKKRLEKMIQNCEIVIFSGSSPNKDTDSIFPFGIEIANKHNKISICDTYGANLENCIERAPTVIHNNISEIKNSLNIQLKEEEEGLRFLSYLYSKGIKQVYLTDGEKDTYASNFDYHYRVKNPKIETVDSTGSGDSFVAGIAYGLYKDLTFEESLTLASSLGALNASTFDVCNISLEYTKRINDDVIISTIGKKIKAIDVTPH
jgi:1-phosphofructokinase family hexose kinase